MECGSFFAVVGWNVVYVWRISHNSRLARNFLCHPPLLICPS